MVEEDKTVKKAVKTSVKKAAVKSVKKAAKTSVKEVVAAPEKKVSPAPEKKAAKKSAQKSARLLSLTLIRSKHGRLASHKACVAGLGLRRMHQRVEVIDTPENRGMIKKVHYLLNVEEV